MRSKGAIRFLAILVALVSFYYLSFTYVTKSIESDAAEYAKRYVARAEANLGEISSERKIEYLDSITNQKERFYLDSIGNDVVFLWKYSYKDCKQREFNLGLDLKGGMNATLEIEVEEVVKAMCTDPNDETFVKVLNRVAELQENSQADFVDLFGKAFNEISPDGKMSTYFMTPELRDLINFDSKNDEVLSVLKRKADAAIDNSFKILRKRIDQFGVIQPKIQQLDASGRILIELPGVKDANRIKNLLQRTAQLEFWVTYENQEVRPFLIEANNVVKEIEEAKAPKVEEKATEEKAEEAKSDENSLDDLAKADSLSNDNSTNIAKFKKDNPLFAILHLSNQYGSEVGYALAKDKKAVDAYLANEKVKGVFPRNLKFYWSAKGLKVTESRKDQFLKSWEARGVKVGITAGHADLYALHAIKITSRDNKCALGGDVITKASQGFDQNQGEAEVSMVMNSKGAKQWARLTKEAASKTPKQCIAIVLDDLVQSAPRVSGEIPNGTSQITGDFTIAEAKDLANMLESGSLPAPAKIIQSQIVGPSLGQESINKGLMSFIIAFIAILLYMVFYYSRSGWVANLALVSNLFFILGVLASFGAVLTLPGIAGIVLTIGISVDSNVLIFERIKEELAQGKGLRAALADGYNNAYSAIIDANVTSLVTAIILYKFGSGPIQGFATTLMFGIFTSLFAAIFITRLIFERMTGKDKVIKFSTALTEKAFKKTNIDFLGKKKTFFVISAILIVVSIGSLVTRGLNKGVDFTGGHAYIIRFDKKVQPEAIRNALKVSLGETPEAKTFGADNQIGLTTKYLINDKSSDVDEKVDKAVYKGLKSFLPAGTTFDSFTSENIMSSHKVGPTIADDLVWESIIAVALSLIMIFLYIYFRFKYWRFGLGALAALAHDVIILLGIFSLGYGVLPFSLEIDQAFIAAILTVIGYSINDTVVVFDRIREFFKLHPKHEPTSLMNSALNSTMSRTFSTSISTFLVLLVIFIFGGEVIRGFVFAMMIGVVVGTYSSLFIATPVAESLMKPEAARAKK